MTELKGKEVAVALTATTVTLVTSKDAEGDCVATCAWANPLSHEPSMIGVCLRPGGRTAEGIRAGGCFCVNVLPAGAGDIAVACGKKGAGQPERFETAGLEKAPAACIDAVRVGQAVSWIECELVESHVFGDHELFVGRTLIAQTTGEAPLLMEGRSAFGQFAADDK